MAVIEAIEKCDNCGRSIGKLEPVYVWDKSHSVCCGCLSILESTKIAVTDDSVADVELIRCWPQMALMSGH